MVAESQTPETPGVGPLIDVDRDGMTAYLTLAERGTAYVLEDVERALAAAGVTYGVDEQRLALMLLLGLPATKEPIALGTPPGDPVDGYIEHLFPSAVRALEERGGRVDWRELHLVHSVGTGAPIARRHAGVPATPGRDVRGNLVQGKKHPKEPRLALGTGVQLDEHDPNLMVSTIAGSVRVDAAGRIGVEPTYAIQGNVDLSVGNIDFAGTVLVNGDILSGFTVKAMGDVEVRGIIEDATVIAGGSVMSQSIIASGTRGAPVQAGTDIVARMARNALLIAGKDVLIGQEAVNCEIEAHGQVRVGGEHPVRGIVAGGSVQAAQRIVAYNVGSPSARTKLRTGYDWIVPEIIRGIEGGMDETQRRLDRTMQAVRMLQELRAAKKLDDGQTAQLHQLLSGVETLQAALRSLSIRRDAWTRLASTASSIEVFGTILEGTELVIDGKARRLTDDRAKERFFNESGHVIGVAIRY